MAQVAKAHKQFTLQVHVTSACDANCAHCYQRSVEQAQMTLLEFETLLDQYQELLDQLSEKNGTRYQGAVSITGGEPLLHPQFKQMALDVMKRGFRLSVLTNGHLLDKSTATLLRNAAFVQVSLDGSKKVHDEIRSEGDYKSVMDAIRLLKECGANPVVSFTAHAGNYQSLPKAARAAKKAGANRFWSDRFLPLDADAETEPLSLEETVEYLDILGKAAKERQGIVARGRALQFLCGGVAYRCHAARNLLAVTERCEVLPCRRLPLPLGDFRDTPLAQIYWESDDACALREFEAPETCAECKHVGSCAGGLRCLAAAQEGDWHLADPGCPIAHASQLADSAKKLPVAQPQNKLYRIKGSRPRFRGLARMKRSLGKSLEAFRG